MSDCGKDEGIPSTGGLPIKMIDLHPTREEITEAEDGLAKAAINFEEAWCSAKSPFHRYEYYMARRDNLHEAALKYAAVINRLEKEEQ